MTRLAAALTILLVTVLAHGADAAQGVFRGGATVSEVPSKGLLDLPVLTITADDEGRVVMDLPALKLVGPGRLPSQQAVQGGTIGGTATGTGGCGMAAGSGTMSGTFDVVKSGQATWSGPFTFELTAADTASGLGYVRFSGTVPALGAIFEGAGALRWGTAGIYDPEPGESCTFTVELGVAFNPM